MKTFSRCVLKLVTGLAIAATAGTPALAQEASFPSRPIHIVVPFPPGGGTDLLSRVVAQELSAYFKQPVLVENRPGGNTLIASQHVAASKPDGYTVFTSIDSTMVMNPFLYKKLPYDPMKDFVPVTLATTQPMVIAVNPSFPAKTLPELIEYLKSNPTKGSYAFGAIPAQVVGEMFKEQAKAPMMAVPYNGSAAAVQDVIGGHLPVVIDALSPALAHIQGGRLRALAVTTAERAAILPDVPTVAESGVPGFDIATWTGFFAPAGVDPKIVAKLHEGFKYVLATPGVQKKFADLGLKIVGQPTAEFTRLIESDSEKYSAVIKSAGITIQ